MSLTHFVNTLLTHFVFAVLICFYVSSREAAQPY